MIRVSSIFEPMNEVQLSPDELFMYRCIELAKLGAGRVAPNPMVGAVLVHGGNIIGEGYHQQFGEAHAEVNCIRSVAAENQHLISKSTLYVSLEPCVHFGKTPPCTDLVIQHKIPNVVIGARDPFEQVDGKGIEQLRNAGVEVVFPVLEEECVRLNKRFFTFHQQHRPYVILKWAQTADSKISSGTAERLMISNELSNRLVHKWRSEEAAILVGTSTALLDDPSLNVRSWQGNDPIRLIIDMDLSLPSNLKIFDQTQRTIIFNTLKHNEGEKLSYYQVTSDVNIVHQILNACYQLNIQSVLVEGGAKLLQSFIDDGSWDETRVITNTQLFVESGLQAPSLSDFSLHKQESLLTDSISYFRRNVSSS
jgi:diaminohydroxyphosphoribosylaminopyrimidine deaminase/5-amino-6-(5-phosphoribosylamino)uracil reductase